MYLPTSTDKKNKCIGTLSIGDDMFKNQFGVIGKRRRNNKKKNKLSIFSSIYKREVKIFKNATCRHLKTVFANGLNLLNCTHFTKQVSKHIQVYLILHED